MTDRIAWASSGLGYWGPNLARNFERLPDTELAYCCDLVAENLAQARAQFPGAS